MAVMHEERTGSNGIGTKGASSNTYRFQVSALVVVTALCVYAYARPFVPIVARASESAIHHAPVVSSEAKQPTGRDEPKAPYSVTHVIQPGDTLSGIFSNRGIGSATLDAVLAADEELLALDVLRPGNELRFEASAESGDLVTLSLVAHPGKTIHYRRGPDEVFEFEEEIKPSHWQEDVLSSRIHGSFYAAASQAGLSDSEILQAQRILEDQVDFRRDIRADDRFEIIISREMVDAGATGQVRIDAIRLEGANLSQSAFLHSDGNYYDDNGESLSRAFLRQPMQGSYRVSSPFNLRRLHPVTKRIAPHHGVDFAMPTGTPILSTGDGFISRVGHHPYAGKYIEIEHPGQFKTRYLHLSHIKIKQGQHVRRGDRIALSGNTGRSTGPHLHFELHVNNRPVDPLVADIPTATRIPANEMASFRSRIATLVAEMDSRFHLASRLTLSDQNTDS